MKKSRPFLKWAGNKFRCLEHILGILPQAQRLIEPFTGSAAVSINTNYPHYVLAEINKDLVNLYRCLQQEGKPFISFCEHYFCSTNNTAERYYQFREQFNQCNDEKQRAALFLYLNRHGYNGLCRYNQKGIYNVPFGRYVKPYFPLVEMLHFYQKCQSATITHMDFRATFAAAKPGDLIYCDPPYVPRHQRSNFSAYTDQKFGENEQIELVHLAKISSKKGSTVIISNHDTEFTRYHYRDSDIISFEVKRSISCLAAQRVYVRELIAIFRPR